MSIKYLPPSHVNLQHVQWLSGSSELADLNLLLFFEMNEPVCFKVSLPALFSLHERWGVGHGKEADKIKRTFKCFGVSTCLEDSQINNIRRTKEWLADGVTKGKVHDEYGSRCLVLEAPKSLAIGMDVVERRTRNREKLKKMAAQLLHDQPWQHDHNMSEEHTVRVLTNYLASKPFYGKTAEANDITMQTPSWIIFDKEKNVIFRFIGNALDVHLRDELLPYLMGVKKIKPLLTEEFRQSAIAEYRRAKKYAPGAHVGSVVVHHDGKVNLDAPKEEPKDAAKEEKKDEKK